MNSRVVAFVLLVSLVGSLPASVVALEGGAAGQSTLESTADTAASVEAATAVAGGAHADTGSATPMADADDVLHRTTVLRHLPKRPGEFETEMTFAVPEPVSSLEIELEEEAEVVAAEGFEATGEGTYRWTETTDEPTVRFTMPADRRGDVAFRSATAEGAGARNGSGSAAADGASRDGYTFVDTGDWGVVQVPGVGLSYRKTESVEIGVAETVTVDGPGAAGADVAFFGPVTEHERTVDGETIRLAVPEAAEMHESPGDVLDALAAASERLRVGSSTDEVFVVAVPNEVDWAARGLQYGHSDAWVVADADLERASNVWLHEYVHVRQRYANGDVGTASEVGWLVEAQAEYYAGLLAYEQGLISAGEFEDFLERGERSPYADGVLAEPTTWADEDTAYVKGPLVYGEIDRRLRLATDGDRTADDVFRELNAREERVSGGEFLAAVADAGGEDVRSVAERYTRTAATPDAWSRFDHRAAFDRPRATIEYGLGSEPIAVADRPWERWDRAELSGPSAEIGSGDVLAVPAGKRVAVPVALENVDDRAGTADATLQVDGRIVDYERTRLEAGESATATLSWESTDPGVYDVRVGSDRLTVYVRSTPSLTVTALRAGPDGADPGEPVTATATVTTSGDLPGAGALAFRTADGTAFGDPIALEPGETGTVEAELTFGDSGRYEVTAGGRSTTVTVGVLGKIESVPGFGAAAGVAALWLAIVALGHRRSE